MGLMDTYHKVDAYTKSHEDGLTLVFAILICLISLKYGYLIWTTDNYVGETVMYNFPYADAIFNGIAPYTPDMGMRWEYPPFAYLLMLIPRFFTSDVNVYEVLYVVEVTVFLIIGLILIRKLANHYGMNPFVAFFTYVLSIFLLDYFIYDRFDVIVAVIVLAATYLVLKGHTGWAVFLIIFGMFVKLYPALLIPLLMIPHLAQGRFIIASKLFGLSIILCVLFILPFIWMSPDNVWNFMSYHGDRGLQIESVAASFIMFIGLFIPLDYYTDHSFGSYNISGSICDSVASIMMLVMIIMIVLIYVLYYLHCRRTKGADEDKGMLMVFFLVIMAFIIFNKVFSAQYVIWALLLLIPVLFVMSGEKQTLDCSLICVVMMLFTMWMVDQYDSLLSHEAYGIILLFVRNIIFVWMMVYVLKESRFLESLKNYVHS